MSSKKYLPYARAAAVVAALYAMPAQADDEPQAQQQGTVAYLSGGIGKDEVDSMEAARHNYNLRIMSADKTGHFSGDIHIVVSDNKSHKQLEATGGPLFYVNLPEGKYTVQGFNDDQSRKQTVTIAGGKPASVHFVWN